LRLIQALRRQWERDFEVDAGSKQTMGKVF
jgi:hypothetical protein